MQLDLETRKIWQPYLLVAGTCPSYISATGQRYLNELWARDLALHPEYITDLTVAAPCIAGDPPQDAVPVSAFPSLARVSFVDLPPPSRSLLSAMPGALDTFIRLWRAIGGARIVHAGIAGWPYPLGWIAIFIAKFRRKFVLIVVESAPWRIAIGEQPSLKRRARALICEVLNRRCVGVADLNVFTTEEYFESLVRSGRHGGIVIHASWVNDEDILPNASAVEDWNRKLSGGALRLLFAARLTREKGLETLLQALRRLPIDGGEIDIDIAGSGPLKTDCEAFIATYRGPARINLIGTVRYGSEFFSLLRSYHAVLVPNLGDEQPRIVYDAFSQAVPVLAADTPGLRSCVQAGVTGCLDDPGSADSLSRRLIWARGNIAQLRSMGLAGLDVARNLTHRKMHQRRLVVLESALSRSDATIPAKQPHC